MMAPANSGLDQRDAPGLPSLLGYSGGTLMLRTMAVCFTVYWACVLPVWPGPRNVSDTALRLLSVSAAMIMWYVSAYLMRGLLRARDVLGARQTPSSLWRGLLWMAVRRATTTWLLLCGAMVAAFMLIRAPMHASAGAALVSLAALLAGVCGLGQRRAMVSIIRCSCAALVIWLITDASLFKVLGNAPPTLLAAVTTAFPLTLLWAAQRWSRVPPLVRWRPATAPSRKHRLLLQLRRFSLLRWRRMPVSTTDQPVIPALQLFNVAISVIYPAFMLVYLLLPVWRNGQIDVWRLGVMLWVAGIISNTLIARDVGWRSFLMPGGLQRSRIGSHIFAWTLAGQMLGAAAYALLALGVLSVLPGAHGQAAHRFAQALLDAATAPLELMFITSVAVALRVMPYTGKVAAALGVLTVGALGWATLHWERAMALATGKLTVSLPLYFLILCAASAMLVLMANRWWTPERLFHMHSD